MDSSQRDFMRVVFYYLALVMVVGLLLTILTLGVVLMVPATGAR